MYTIIMENGILLGVYDEVHQTQAVNALKGVLKQTNIYDDDLQDKIESANCIDDLTDCIPTYCGVCVYRSEVNCETTVYAEC